METSDSLSDAMFREAGCALTVFGAALSLKICVERGCALIRLVVERVVESLDRTVGEHKMGVAPISFLNHTLCCKIPLK